MDVTKRRHDKYYGRVMPRVYRQSDTSLKSSSLVVRHELPSVCVGAKPPVSKRSGIFSELPTVLNDYVPDLGKGKIEKRSLVSRPRRTIKSLDPAKSPPHRTVKNVSEFGERFCVTNVRAHDSDPVVLNQIKDSWSDTHVRQCYSSRSHIKLKELKDEIKAYHDTEKKLKFRNNLYKSCGLVLNEEHQVAVDKAVQSESVKTDIDDSVIRSEQRHNGEDARALMPDQQMKSEQPRYPVDRYLVESSKFEMVNIIDDEIWNSDPALRPEDEIILRKLHDMLQSTADDLRLLSGELSKFHEPGPQAKTSPMPLDEEFNEKVHIEEVVNAKFHGYKIIDKQSTSSPISRSKNISVDDKTAVINNVKKPKVLNTGIQVNTMPILKKTTTNRNLSRTRTKILQINETINNENVKYQKLNNKKILNTVPAVTYNEFSYKYKEPERIPTKVLQIQEMPSISIRGELREQKVLHLDIVPNTKDVEHNIASDSNVAVIAMKHGPTPLLEQSPNMNYKQIKQQCTNSSGIVKKEPIRKVSRMSTYDSSESTNNINSEAQHKLKKKPRTAFKKLLKSPENRKFTESRNRDKTDKHKRETYKQPHCNVEEWRRKLNAIYGQPSSSRNSKSKSNNKLKKATPKPSSITRPQKHTLNNAEYVPYSQLTLGGVRVSDVEREISDMPNKNDIPLSPILDKILSSREKPFDQNKPFRHKKDSSKILTTSDENLLQEVVDIERTISETLSKNMKSKEKEAPTKAHKLSSASNEVDDESYPDDFEDDKSEHSEKSDRVIQSREGQCDPVISDMSSQDGNDNKLSDGNNSDGAKSDSDDSNKNIQNITYTKTPNLTLKNSIEIFEFIHTVDTQDTATQSNTTHKISLKETQTSPRNDRPNLQAIHNDLWPSIDPRGQVEKMFELEKDFIKKLIIDEYGDLLEKTITKPSTSKENNKSEKQGRNISESQKNTQTSPAHMKSVMTSPTITKTRTTSPFALSLTVDRQTSPVILLTNEEDMRVEIQNEPEDQGISINLSSPRFSLRLPQTSNDVLSNLEILCQSNSNKSNKSYKSKTFTKSNMSTSSSSSVDADKSSSEISSLGEVNLKLQRRLRNNRKPTTSDSSSSSLYKYSSDFQSDVFLPLRSEGEISVGEAIKRKTNKSSKSEGEMSLKP